MGYTLQSAQYLQYCVAPLEYDEKRNRLPFVSQPFIEMVYSFTLTMNYFYNILNY
jgi:hypothetical protein